MPVSYAYHASSVWTTGVSSSSISGINNPRGANPIMVGVAVSQISSGSGFSDPSVTSMTVGGQNFTKLRADILHTGPFPFVSTSIDFWYLVGPTFASSSTATVNFNSTVTGCDFALRYYNGVNQASPFDTSATFNGSETGTVSNSITVGVTNGYLLDALFDTGTPDLSPIAGAGQTIITFDQSAGNECHSDKALSGAPGSYLMSWSALTNGTYIQTIVSLNPASQLTGLPGGQFELPTTMRYVPGYSVREL